MVSWTTHLGQHQKSCLCLGGLARHGDGEQPHLLKLVIGATVVGKIVGVDHAGSQIKPCSLKAVRPVVEARKIVTLRGDAGDEQNTAAPKLRRVGAERGFATVDDFEFTDHCLRIVPQR